MYSQIASNKRKSVLIVALFIVVAASLAWFLGFYMGGDPSISIIVVFIALVYALIAYFNAGKMAVAMQGAVEVTEKDEPRLYRTVENLTITEGMPMPKVYVIEDPALNAFATGRDPDHAIVAATRGLLNTLDDAELEGVMAHELGHVKNYDIRVSMLAFALISVVAILSDILLRSMIFGGSRRENNNAGAIIALIAVVFAILAPITAKLLQLAVSRQREYLADATGAMTTRYPEGLASALEKISKQGSTLKAQNSATAHLFIANPLSGKDKMKSLFSTHPPAEERIRRLREMGGQL